MRIKLDIPLSLAEIVRELGGSYKGKFQKRQIEYVCTDSRECCKGDLFIALKGERYDGNDFVPEALALGAIPLSSVEAAEGIKVGNVNDSLPTIARLYKSKLPRLKKVCAITGSLGKSTTKEFSSIILSEHFSVTKSYGNYNNCVGLCLSILSAKRDTEILVLELGMNLAGEISALSKIAEPDIAIITSVGTSHIGRLGSREAIAKAKLEILDGMKPDSVLIIPYGEPLLCRDGALTFSTKNSKADYYLRGEYTRTDLYYGERWLFDGEFSISEKHLLDCLAPALALACEIGVPISKIKSGMQKISRYSIRQKFERVGELTLYSDCYNASLESVGAALKYISSLRLYPKRSAVLGSVFELGEMSEGIHREIGALAGEANCRALYLIGEYADFMAEGATNAGMDSEKIFRFDKNASTDEVARAIIDNSSDGELVLFKGSRAMRLELIVERIKEIKEKVDIQNA